MGCPAATASDHHRNGLCVCAWIVEAMRSAQEDRSEIGFVIEEAKGLTRLLNDWRISRVKREGNNVGNALASLARHSKMSKAWLEKTPPGVEA